MYVVKWVTSVYVFLAGTLPPLSKTLGVAQTLCQTLRIMGTLRPESTVLEITWQMAAAEVQCARSIGVWIHLNIVLYSNYRNIA